MLYDKLKEYGASGVYPMHMPGHKRNAAHMPGGMPCDIDITEIHGFDDLYDPRGVLRDTAELAAGVYGSDKAFLLVNGSSVGILSAIGAHTKRGDKILIARNCHRSVCNAAELFGLEPVFVKPETDGQSGVLRSVEPGSIESALDEDPLITLVVVTSPSYEGVVSDIRSIAGIVHEHDIPLLVDSAHGAHLGFSPYFPDSAAGSGADIVVISLHKTLPALTQCSLLHACGDRADVDEIARLLSTLQTSSPSYVLMASIDSCLRLIKSDNAGLFREYEKNLRRFDEDIRSIRNLSVLCHGASPPSHGFFGFDPGKLVIVTRGTPLSGTMLADVLREEHRIELELACGDYAIAMTSLCDTAEGFARLADALCAIDRSLKSVAILHDRN